MKINYDYLTQIFALHISYMYLLWVFIGSLDCPCPLKLTIENYLYNLIHQGKKCYCLYLDILVHKASTESSRVQMRVFLRWRHLQVVNSLPSIIEYVMGRVNPRVVRRDSVTGVYWNVMLLDIRVNGWNYALVQFNPYWMASLGEMDSGRITIEKPSLDFDYWLPSSRDGH